VFAAGDALGDFVRVAVAALDEPYGHQAGADGFLARRPADPASLRSRSWTQASGCDAGGGTDR
jgi:hypothetical protein